MSRRDQIEQVLRKHLVESKESMAGISHWQTLDGTIEEISEDLLACVPKPLRGTLAIMLQEGFTHKVLAILTEPIPGRTQTWFDKLLDDLMTWATGQTERRWCEHCQWSNIHSRWEFSEAWMRQECPDPTWGFTRVSELWRQCPICAAPRPEDA